jgi:23S rRNA pseudouridine2605 synthase
MYRITGDRMEERLQKVMAELGVASRRKCEELILSGKVHVDGRLVSELGTKVDKQKAVIEVEGQRIAGSSEKVYMMLNKPVGYITSAKDQFNRPAVLELVPQVRQRIFPVGRLDYDTEGLLLLTNDGDLTYLITHPSHQIHKTYRALVKGKVGGEAVGKFAQGLKVEDYVTAPARLEIIRYIEANTLIEVTIHEGRNRQVRKMCDAIGHPVLKLKRIRIGKLGLGDLKTGQWRYLTKEEVEYLYSVEVRT